MERIDLASLLTLRGPKGDKGDPGTGLTLLGRLADDTLLPLYPDDGDAYLIGDDIHVAVEGVWTNAGPVRGPEGPQGPRGVQGAPGVGHGDDAYTVAVQEGFVGTKAEWLASLVGPPGDAADLTWGSIADKPATYPPAAHNHDATYSPVGHNHDGTYAPVTHTHGASDLTATGTADAFTYLRGDNVWGTPPNTTYSLMSLSEAQTGTATTQRTLSAQRLKQAIQYHAPAETRFTFTETATAVVNTTSTATADYYTTVSIFTGLVPGATYSFLADVTAEMWRSVNSGSVVFHVDVWSTGGGGGAYIAELAAASVPDLTTQTTMRVVAEGTITADATGAVNVSPRYRGGTTAGTTYISNVVTLLHLWR